jgi:plastocyanin
MELNKINQLDYKDDNNKENPSNTLSFELLKRQSRIYAVSTTLIILSIALAITSIINHNSNKASVLSADSAVVQITPTGFVPETLKIKPGTTVIWKNSDTIMHQIASNPYPLNNSVPGLLSNGLLTDQSYSYTFKTDGTYGYHDQDDPLRLTGVISVE